MFIKYDIVTMKVEGKNIWFVRRTILGVFKKYKWQNFDLWEKINGRYFGNCFHSSIGNAIAGLHTIRGGGYVLTDEKVVSELELLMKEKV
jgi:hypothetical protein